MPKISGEVAWLSIILSVVGCICYSVGVASPLWRQNPSGLGFYFSTRTWGLFTVHGYKTQTHWAIYAQACEFAGMHSTLGNPMSPLALWYTQKCTAYHFIMIVSYVTAAFLIFSAVLQGVSLFMFLRHNAGSVMTSSLINAATFCMGVGCMTAYVVVTDAAFEEIESVAVFPRPENFVSFYVTVGGVVVDLFATVCKCAVWRKLKALKSIEDEAYNEAYGAYGEVY
eukprot:Platyproteum_vivax@DN14534_c0_g1_i1.p1